MKVAIIHFPGTNCERDTQYAFDKLGCETKIIWHKETSVDTDLIILPGGFSYGDYLRTAAIAKFSPIMNAVINHAKKAVLCLNLQWISNAFRNKSFRWSNEKKRKYELYKQISLLKNYIN